MEANGGASEQVEAGCRKKVLAAVLLHVGPASGPIDFARYFLFDWGQVVDIMLDSAILLFHGQYAYSAQPSRVVGLAASSGIKEGAVERDAGAFAFLSLQHLSGETTPIRIGPKKFACGRG